MTPHFPQETVDNIIDQLCSEHIWSTTSFVSRAWRNRCQWNLFREVIIATASRLKSFEALLCDSPHLSNYVVILTLGFNDTLHEARIDISSFSSSKIYSGMKRLRAVTLCGFSIGGIESQVNRGPLFQLLSRLPVLASLSFTTCDMDHNALYSVLMLRRSLSLLYLNGCTVKDGEMIDSEVENIRAVCGGRVALDCGERTSQEDPEYGNTVTLREASQGTIIQSHITPANLDSWQGFDFSNSIAISGVQIWRAISSRNYQQPSCRRM